MTTEPLGSDVLQRLRAFLRSQVADRHDVEDLVQEVALRYLRRGEEVEEDRLVAWLLRVARNRVVDRARASRVLPLAEGAELAAEREDSAAERPAELGRCLVKLMGQLAETDRELVERVDLEGASQAALATEFGVSPSTVKSRVQRARARLKARLDTCCEVAHDPYGQPIEFRRRGQSEC